MIDGLPIIEVRNCKNKVSSYQVRCPRLHRQISITYCRRCEHCHIILDKDVLCKYEKNMSNKNSFYTDR